MEELKKWLIKEINSINKYHYNESVYMWNKGFKKALLETLDKIRIIESEK